MGHGRIGDTNGISTKFWGKGYFNETLKLVLDYLFIDLKINRVISKTPATYLPSINTLRKLGFKVEAQLRDYYKINNEFIYAKIFQF